jgi:hypothetical protein
MVGPIYNQETVRSVIETFIYTPLEQPELLPTVLPLVFGAVVIELYFGKYTQEELGWNTSVGNAVIWATTGITLLMTTSMTQQERYAAYGLIAVGAFVGYMDFNHKWSDSVAFIVSSSGIVYTLAYIAVIMIKTSMPVNATTMKGAAIFLVGVNVVFKVIQSMETSRDTPGVQFNG